MPEPRNLDELRAITDPTERARAVGPYIERAEAKIAEARRVRWEAIAELMQNPALAASPTKVAREVGVSSSTVKNIRDGRTK